jgi:hypothetical protein
MTDFKRTMLATDEQNRAVIHRRPDGYFAVQFERYDDSIVTGIGAMSDPFWRMEEAASIMPTLEAAERLASDRLGLTPA